MGKARNPRHGSMQFWPRVRAKRQTARVRSWASSKDAKPLGFAGYKVGMTHVIVKTEQKGKKDYFTGVPKQVPVTIIECPPIKVLGARAYQTHNGETKAIKDIYTDKPDKIIDRILVPAKKRPTINDLPEGYDYLHLLVHTQPKQSGLGKKTPEIFEVGIGGSKEDQLNYVKENLGKELNIQDIFAEGEFVDVHAVTTGKGFQGPVKRFGVALREKKAEKTKRGPGSLGGWIAQAHTMYRIAHAGQMGYHTRTQYNSHIFKISDSPEQINAKGGFLRYGNVKSNYILVKGSIHGPTKRLIRLNKAMRANPKKAAKVPEITYVSTLSKQGKSVQQ